MVLPILVLYQPTLVAAQCNSVTLRHVLLLRSKIMSWFLLRLVSRTAHSLGVSSWGFSYLSLKEAVRFTETSWLKNSGSPLEVSQPHPPLLQRRQRRQQERRRDRSSGELVGDRNNVYGRSAPKVAQASSACIRACPGPDPGCICGSNFFLAASLTGVS